MEYSGAGGKLIHEKNQKQKISWHCPFKVSTKQKNSEKKTFDILWAIDEKRAESTEPDPDLDPYSSVWIQESGSVSKCHGSGTLSFQPYFVAFSRLEAVCVISNAYSLTDVSAAGRRDENDGPERPRQFFHSNFKSVQEQQSKSLLSVRYFLTAVPMNEV